MTIGRINLSAGGVPADTFGSWTNLDSIADAATRDILNFSDGVDTGWNIEITDTPQTDGTSGVDAVGTGDAAWVDAAIISDE